MNKHALLIVILSLVMVAYGILGFVMFMGNKIVFVIAILFMAFGTALSVAFAGEVWE